MKSTRFVLSALLIAGLSNFAQASEFAPIVSAPESVSALEDSLPELLSPEELDAEMENSDFVTNLRAAGPYTDRLYIYVDKSVAGSTPTSQTMNVYLDGSLIYTWKVSTGRETPEVAKSGKVYRSITPTGKYRITRLSRNHVSTTWQASMPFAMFFIGGIAIHATTPSHFAALGTRDSGGCVRLHPTNAETIWNLVQQVGSSNVLIEVQNKSQY